MKATAFLQRQHRVLEDLLEKLSKPRTDKPPLQKELSERFRIYADGKLAQFYPAVRELKPELIEVGSQDLLIAGELVEALLACEPEDARFYDAVETARELIEHRIDEDEAQLFPEVERRIDATRLEQLANAMEERLIKISSHDEIRQVIAIKKRAA